VVSSHFSKGISLYEKGFKSCFGKLPEEDKTGRQF
jgi:hypothetical protein